MSYAIVTPPQMSINPVYAYLSGDLGAFWNKKSVRKRVQARRAARKASGKKVKAGKVIAAVLTGGVSLAIKKKKKGKAASTPRAVAAPVSVRPVAVEAPTLEAATSALRAEAETAAQTVPPAAPFPWLAVAIGVGAVALLGTTIVLVRR